MVEYYNIISIFVTGGLLLGLGLILLFLGVPDNPGLENYRKARYPMACAYLFFAAIGIVEYLCCNPSESNIPLIQTVTLAIAVSQAFLFTHTLLALVTVEFPGWRSILRRAIPAILLISAVFTLYLFCMEACFKIAFYGFAGIYALMLIYYTRLFIVGYRLFRTKLDNYFSDFEADRLRWIAFSFFAALSLGVMALLSALFVSILVALLFSVVFNVFYAWFAIRFLNYPYLFQTIEAAMEIEPAEERAPAESEEAVVEADNTAFVALKKRIEPWVVEKGFTETGITINFLAMRLATNRSYLSKYINTVEKKTFRAWINGLRIEEAMKLLRQDPQMNMTLLASQVGFTDKSNFIRQFIHQTGLSPRRWQESNQESPR